MVGICGVDATGISLLIDGDIGCCTLAGTPESACRLVLGVGTTGTRDVTGAYPPVVVGGARITARGPSPTIFSLLLAGSPASACGRAPDGGEALLTVHGPSLDDVFARGDVRRSCLTRPPTPCSRGSGARPEDSGSSYSSRFTLDRVDIVDIFTALLLPRSHQIRLEGPGC